MKYVIVLFIVVVTLIIISGSAHYADEKAVCDAKAGVLLNTRGGYVCIKKGAVL